MLDDFLPLLPAEEKLRHCAATAENCLVKGHTPKSARPKRASANNRVRARFLRYLILGGCEQTPVSGRGIRLEGAYIDCEAADCMDLESTDIDVFVFLVNCTLNGELRLVRSSLVELNLIGTSVEAIDADGIRLANSMRLKDGFISERTINLRNARIGGNLTCHGAVFLDPNNAIIANRTKIEGDVDFGNIQAKGTIALTGADIGGDFMPQGAVLEGTPALQLRNSKIGGTLHWRGLGFVDGEVDLTGASCKILNTGNTSWLRKHDKYSDRRPNEDNSAAEKKPVEYQTKLDNFTYEGFSNLPDNVKSEYWIEWLKQQPDEHLGERFKPRPWEQLASVLDSMGYEEEARDVRIEKQRLLSNFMINHEQIGFSVSSIWHWLQILFRVFLWGPVVAYGYRPGNALLWLFGFILVGSLIYHKAANEGVMAPTHPLVYKEASGGFIPKICAENWVYFEYIRGIDDDTVARCKSAVPSEYSEFQSFVYAADVALPIVNLRMEDDWAPRVVDTAGLPHKMGWWVRTFEWMLIAIGWILSLLFVSAVGASIRR